ncbi:MAG: anthranilate synthase component I [Dehalococcoidales bacterium]|nr:MAG: anthranilate synthase component I [Dehalococcoidales bacterium]
MYFPTLEQVRERTGEGNLIPIYREIMADLETPVTAFLKIARGSHSFLLESVEGGERMARYSFIGTEPYRVLRTGPDEETGVIDPLVLIQQELEKYRLVPLAELPRFHGGAVGYLSYEAVRYFEELPSPEVDTLQLPEAIMLFTDTMLVFDHLMHKIKVVSHVHLDGNVEEAYAQAVEKIESLVQRLRQPLQPPRNGERLSGESTSGEVTSNMSPERHAAIVNQAKQYIYDGEIIQAVLSQRLSRKINAHPFDIYRALRTVNPSPYMYYLHLDDCYIVGSSPELLVRAENNWLTYHPLAGTRPRTTTDEENAALEAELRADEKERAEHIMLVDLGRNDIGRVSEPGTVQVNQLMDVEHYSHVMHIVSNIVGKLRSDLTPYDALRSCFPAGTVSGAPKIRAMEIIAELEPDKRGPYAGAVGYFCFSGNMDTAIAIRTMVITKGVAYVQAGGGIVADSVPETEYNETVSKASALLQAIEVAEAMRSGG